MATQFDVIVISAGIVGASAAYYLAKTGNRVAAPLAIEMRKLVAWGAPADASTLPCRKTVSTI